LDNPTIRKNYCEADIDVDMELGNGMENQASLELREVCAAPKFPEVI